MYGFSIHSLGLSPCWESELPFACQAALLSKGMWKKELCREELGNLGFAYRPPSQSG